MDIMGTFWRIPTLEQIKAKEQLALGHTDYGAKWAHGVAELLRATPSIQKRKACDGGKKTLPSMRQDASG